MPLSSWTPTPLRHPDAPIASAKRAIAEIQKKASNMWHAGFTRGQEIGFADAKLKFTGSHAAPASPPPARYPDDPNADPDAHNDGDDDEPP